ncbi:hypothetical protein BHQ23_32405 [Mycobacterium gordonae]|uniref:Uncharacterized protein n=1 Tax=Mycobacterium gordonae TaxID=1778 RepID=A0A1X1WPF4_MYCGO|nr:hypothetical protein BHQ23_32405 [Mycobacterium gordonae]ORV88526.1 hypothetical protein AWC08_22310 [Mycobacterium gordonae]
MGIIGRTCPECGDYFTTNRADRHYCSDDCRNSYGPCGMRLQRNVSPTNTATAQPEQTTT